jgi:hypothetical protein
MTGLRRYARSDPKGERMKKGTMTFLLALFLLSGVGKALAQEKIAITVKGTELNNGVVIVDVLKAGKGFELQCNQGASSCTLLKSGKYLMVELPSNSGMYDCKDVQIYSDPSSGPGGDQKIGEYCLVAK